MNFHKAFVCLTDERGVLTSQVRPYLRLADRTVTEWVFVHAAEVAEQVFCYGTPEVLALYEFATSPTPVTFLSSYQELQDAVKETNGSLLLIEANQPLLNREGLEPLLKSVTEQAESVSFLSAGEMMVTTRVLAASSWRLIDLLSGIDPSIQPLLSELVAKAQSQMCAREVVLPTGTTRVTVIDERSRMDAQALIRLEMIRTWQESGVIFDDPSTVQLDASVELYPGAVIGVFTVLRGKTVVESGAKIHAYTFLENALICEGADVWMSSVVDSTLEPGASIGPYAYLRGNSIIKRNAQIGAYSEINDTVMGEGSKCKHFAYIGHTEVGPEANIGAGTITCTYDGERKYRSVIGSKAFIGSGTLLVAPARIGDGAMTGAGSVVTKEIPAGTLCYGTPAIVIRNRNTRQQNQQEEK